MLLSFICRRESCQETWTGGNAFCSPAEERSAGRWAEAGQGSIV